MQRRIRSWAILAALLLSVPANRPARAAETVAPAELQKLIDRATRLERERHWLPALESFERAVKALPQRSDLQDHLKLCETHYRIARRYHDHSFRSTLLRLPRETGLNLYDELLAKIQANYVDPVNLGVLYRRGVENLATGLGDAEFLAANLPGVPAEQVEAFSTWLTTRYQLPNPGSRWEAVQALDALGAQARQSLGVNDLAVILEFVFGACDALDDYSSYLTPDRLADLYALIDGNFVGLGVELKSDDEGLLVVNVLAGGPAAEAGVRPSDHITGIDGRSTRGVNTDEAASKLQGTSGSRVELWIRSSWETQSHRVQLVRRSVVVKSIPVTRMLSGAPGVGYIQLTAFQKSTTEEFDAAIRQLSVQGMHALILDLRGNPGGLLSEAVEISDRLIESGVIVSTRGRAPGQNYVHQARHDQAVRVPLVVLIDGDSASASEIVAGAIQDHRRGMIVGQTSYGKGSVQSIFPLRTAPAGLRLTTAKFYSPLGRSYSHNGVRPDVPVTRAPSVAAADTWHAPAGAPNATGGGEASNGSLGKDAALEQAIRISREQLAQR